jgi:hypothetical protein
VAATVLALPASADGAPSPDTALARNIEWFGMNIGGGGLFMNAGDDDPHAIVVDGSAAKLDLLLFNLHWPRAHLTVLELHPVFLFGFLGGGARAGARVPLSSDHRHELRFGAFVGLDYYVFHINAVHPTLSLKPHLQYVHNTRIGSVGGGIDVPINFHFQETMSGGDGHSVSVPPVLTGIMVYLRWSIGRRPF